MRSTFSRTFFAATVVLLLTLLFVGFFLRTLLEDYLVQNAYADLDQEAEVIADLAAASYDDGNVSDMDFLMNLDIAGRISGADAVICDLNGHIIHCSQHPVNCSHLDLTVGQEYLNRVLSDGVIHDSGVIQGMYTGQRYVCAMPIADSEGQTLGAVIVSRSVNSTYAVLGALTNIYCFLSLLVTVIAVLAIGFFVKRQVDPLRQVARTARAFGHGDLDARVKIRSASPEEIQQLALAFNNMASSLQKSEYQRQEFVANVSHELKTPMTTIGGYIDGILDGTIPPEKSRHYMQIVSDETKRLNRLVRSMLDISRLQNEGGIPDEKKTSFDLCETAGQVLITFEQKITNKNLRVEVLLPEHPVIIQAEQDSVTQVIYNLLDNAVKFCPQGETLGISIRQSDDKAYTTIFNDGETIPPEELALVFDRFHKIDKSRSRNRDSWGLGLYIVKTILDSHGEDISVASRDGRTEFTFTMPLWV
jgi:signal transduction histidine kinase